MSLDLVFGAPASITTTLPGKALANASLLFLAKGATLSVETLVEALSAQPLEM